MLVCGLKATHDAAVALIDDNRLVFCVELEKLAQNPRYSTLGDTHDVTSIFNGFGHSCENVDRLILDGWGAENPLAPLADAENQRILLHVSSDGIEEVLEVAGYQPKSSQIDLAELRQFGTIRLAHGRLPYWSSWHVAGHVLSAYCASPFAARGECAHVLVWDGGIFPTMYHVDGGRREVRQTGTLFRLFGNAYAQFARQFPPFKDADEHGLSTAGKVMAYVALGKVRPTIVRTLKQQFRERNTYGFKFAGKLARSCSMKLADRGYSGADFIASFHYFLEQLLCATLADYTRDQGAQGASLCITGGCGLNIKWNSAIRASGLFGDVFVPPFPNDSGNALGAACTHLFGTGAGPHLEWSVYSGPELLTEALPPGWSSEPCTIDDLAGLLVESGEPVVFLTGRAELGPRALGNRSILAVATDPAMKDTLNVLKNRECYRPVAPVCLEDRAPQIFEPGTRDPYMIFEHRVRPEWRERIPAVLHVDGTARLQTVSDADHPLLCRLLRNVERLTGVPLLCNTSANCPGKGFFPSVATAARWGRLNLIWSDRLLYRNQLAALSDGPVLVGSDPA